VAFTLALMLVSSAPVHPVLIAKLLIDLQTRVALGAKEGSC